MTTVSLYNPLDKFQSYSVHYVMFVCRTTEDARAFTDQSLNTATLDAISKTDKLGSPIPYGSGNNAYLIMDTRRFSQFAVNSMEYEVLINGLQSGQPHGNLSTKISMVVQDQSGISFLNFLQYVMDEKMQTNFDGMVFMMRVVFVGVADGKPETVQDVTVPMMMIKMELNLDYAKGVYNLQFLPYNNFNVAANDRWMNAYMNASFFTGDSTMKLGPLIDSFEQKLNAASSDFYNKVQSIQSAKAPGTKRGRQVKYMITIPKTWREFTYSGSAVNNNFETIFSKAKDDTARKPGAPKDAHMAIPPGTRITKALELIFRACPDVAKLGGGGAGTGFQSADSVTFYKFFAGMTSNDDYICVHIDVVEFKVPNLIIQQQKAAAAATTNADLYQNTLSDGTRIPKNYAEFNYNFTGKNKDILNFDMKLQDLNIIFQSNLNLGPDAMNQVANQGQDVTGDSNTQGVQNPVNLTSELVVARAYDPILLPANTELELQNFSNFANADPTKLKAQKKSAQDYVKNLSLFYAMAPITAVMTIRGNPLIMDRFNEGIFLEHSSPSTNDGAKGESSTNTDVKATYRANFEANIISKNTHLDANGNKVQEFAQQDGSIVLNNILGTDSYSSVPVFVKVNVKGPNKDFAGDFISGTDFASDILMNNYYVVFKVTNHFERDNFTQTLELWSQNVFGTGKLQTTKSTKTA